MEINGYKIEKGSDLSGIDLSEQDLRNIDFSDCNLSGANFSGSLLTYALFIRSNLKDADFREVKFPTGAEYHPPEMRKQPDYYVGQRSVFAGANLDSANLAGLDLSCGFHFRANFENANIEQTNFSYSNLDQTSFRGARLVGANFSYADLLSSDFSSAKLKRANFHNALLYLAIFKEADLTHAILTESNTEYADFRKANLSFADFSARDGHRPGNSWLGSRKITVGHHARFQEANLSEANFKNSQFGTTYFTDTNLSNANLRKGYFAQSCFRGSTINEAKTFGANLKDINKFLRGETDEETTQVLERFRSRNPKDKHDTNGKLINFPHSVVEANTSDRIQTERDPKTMTVGNDIVEKLQELAELKEKGLIDEEEFKSAKNKLLK